MLKRSTAWIAALACAGALGGELRAAQAPAAGQAALPKAEDVIAKYVTAIGGAAAYRSIQSIHMKGTLDVPGPGLTGTVEIFSMRPAKSLLRADITGMGQQETGYDGVHGWSLDAVQGPALIVDKQLQQLQDDSDFDADLHLPAHVKSMRTVARAQFDGHDAFQLDVMSVSGDESTEYYDAATFLGLGTESKRESPMGTLSVTNFTRDYKKFGKLMMPTTLVERAMGVDQIIHVQSVEFDKVPAATFDPPPAVKALIK